MSKAAYMSKFKIALFTSLMETEPKVRFSPMSGGADINILGYLTKNAKPPPGKTN